MIADPSRSCGQPTHHVDEAVVELADDVVGGHPDVLEEQLGGVGLVLADLVELAAAGEAVASRLDGEERDAAGLLLRAVRAATSTRSAE